MNIKVISRAPHDQFTFNLFKELMVQIEVPANAYYTWSNPPFELVRTLGAVDCSAPVTVLGIKDLLDFWTEFNWWHDSRQPLSDRIEKLAKNNPNTNILLFTSLENLHLEIASDNITIIPWGGDVVNQIAEYQHVVPVLDKNFDSTRHYISLNRQNRDHRVIAVSYLVATGLLDHGVVTYLSQQEKFFDESANCLLDRIGWEFDLPRHEKLREQLIDGYSLIRNKSICLTGDSFDIYGNDQNNNISNFNTKLRSKYQNSFVEIVSESSFSAPSFLVTEKTANSVYGCNFPIILSGVGAVDHLRQLGLDVFDDVVDHSYDNIANPLDRISNAIDLNRRLLSDSDYAKSQWSRCHSRFENNIKVFSTISDWYTQRAVSEFNKFMQQIKG